METSFITEFDALRAEAMPEQLHKRTDRLEELSTSLRPITRGSRGEDVKIRGPIGTGKTTIARFMLEELQEETLDFRWGHVNCIQHSTKSSVLTALVRDAGLGADLRPDAASTAAALHRIQDYDGQFVAVLDDADVLTDPSTLMTLYETEDVSIILVSVGELEFTSEIADRIRSRIWGWKTIYMTEYTTTELAYILQQRAKRALTRGTYTDRGLESIATIADGNARLAITMLRRAAEYCRDNGVAKITPEIVASVEDPARSEVRNRHIASLGTDQRLLYQIIKEAGKIKASDLHDRYEEQAADPKVRSTRRDYLTGLKRYNYIESEGSGRGTVYRHVSQ